MSSNLIQDIKKHLGEKSTEELLDIWTENDRQKWSVEYFEAVRLTLLDRNETIPNQNNHSREPEPISRNKKMRWFAWVLLAVGAGLYIVLSLFIFFVMALFWLDNSMIELCRNTRSFLTLFCIILALALFVLSYTLKEPD